MSDEIIKVLDHISDKFGIAIDWSSANVIPYLQDLMSRMVKYEIITSIASILFVLSITLIVYILYRLAKTEDGKWFGKTVFTAMVIITLICDWFEVDNIIKVTTIPEKRIVEMIRDEYDN